MSNQLLVDPYLKEVGHVMTESVGDVLTLLSSNVAERGEDDRVEGSNRVQRSCNCRRLKLRVAPARINKFTIQSLMFLSGVPNLIESGMLYLELIAYPCGNACLQISVR